MKLDKNRLGRGVFDWATFTDRICVYKMDPVGWKREPGHLDLDYLIVYRSKRSRRYRIGMRFIIRSC